MIHETLHFRCIAAALVLGCVGTSLADPWKDESGKGRGGGDKWEGKRWEEARKAREKDRDRAEKAWDKQRKHEEKYWEERDKLSERAYRDDQYYNDDYYDDRYAGLYLSRRPAYRDDT